MLVFPSIFSLIMSLSCVIQGRGPLSGERSSGTAVDAASGGAISGASPHVGIYSSTGNAPVTAMAAYDAARGPSFDTHRGPAGAVYDVHRGISGPGYDAQKGNLASGYETQRVPGYDAHRRTAYDGHGAAFNGHAAPLYDSQRGSGYDVQRGGYNPSKNVGSDASSIAAGSQGQVASVSNAPYGSATPPARGAGMGHEAAPRGGNAVRR